MQGQVSLSLQPVPWQTNVRTCLSERICMEKVCEKHSQKACRTLCCFDVPPLPIKRATKFGQIQFPYANNMSFPELKNITSVPLKYAPLF